MSPISPILRKQVNPHSLHFYRKSDVLYQLTLVFCRRFLPMYGDRTVDQMTQAARSGKQNIVEGLADGVTSTDMQLRMLNVARASLRELQEDYRDYLTAHYANPWGEAHPRYGAMLSFCRTHDELEEYVQFFEQWSDEEMANTAYTLCRLSDKMMTSYLKRLEESFVNDGGIRERMTAARLGMRQTQREQIAQQQSQIAALQSENAQLKSQLAQLQTENAQLQSRLSQLQSHSCPRNPESPDIRPPH